MAYVPEGTELLPSAAPQPVLLWTPPATRQRRLTIGFRAILAIPHLVVLGILSIAVAVVAVIGWFGALFTGRLPGFAATFFTEYLSWYYRVGAYVLLLTDSYPPFSFTDDGRYPVRLAFPLPGKLNRFAVFFRLLLIIPAWIVALLLAYGATAVMWPVGWLITLIRGQMPAPLHQSLTAALRFLARFYAYYLLVVPTYPGDVFGDTADESAAAGSWLLPVTRGAKRLIVLMMVLGAALAVVVGVQQARNAAKIDGIIAANQVTDAYETLVRQTQAADSAFAACKQSSEPLSCTTSVNRTISADLSAFASTVADISMPAAATAQAQALEQNATKAAVITSQLSTATSLAQYESIYQSSGIGGYLDSIDKDYRSLYQTLHNG